LPAPRPIGQLSKVLLEPGARSSAGSLQHCCRRVGSGRASAKSFPTSRRGNQRVDTRGPRGVERGRVKLRISAHEAIDKGKRNRWPLKLFAQP